MTSTPIKEFGETIVFDAAFDGERRVGSTFDQRHLSLLIPKNGTRTHYRKRSCQFAPVGLGSKARGWCGRTTRQPGQVRKEAAVTRPVRAACQPLDPILASLAALPLQESGFGVCSLNSTARRKINPLDTFNPRSRCVPPRTNFGGCILFSLD